MAKGVTVDLIVDPKKAIDGIDQVGNKAGGLSNVLAGLGTAAVVGLVALGTAAVGAVVGLTSATKAAGEYAENVQLAASQTHLTTEAVQELQYASKVTGVEFETISGTMTKLVRNMGLAADGNEKVASAFAELGVATTDANGNLLDSTQVYSNVITALGQIENPAERDVLAMTLLGKSATELNPLIDGSAGSLAELAAQAHNAGAVLSDDMLAKLAAADDAFDGLGAGVDAAKNALGLTLMPILTQLGTQGTGLLGQFTNAILGAGGDLSKAAPAIGEVVTSAVGLLLGFIPQLLQVGTSMIGALLDGIVSQGPDLIKSGVPILLGFVGTLVKQLPALVDAGLKILTALGEGIAAALPTLIPTAVDALIGIVGAIVENLPLLLDAGLQIITGLTMGLIAALPTLLDALPVLITSLITFLIGAIPQLVDTGITLLLAIVDAIPTVIDALVKALPQIIVAIVTALVAAQPQLIAAGIKLFIGLIGALPQIIVSLVAAVPQIIQGLVTAFTKPSTLKMFSNIGVQLIAGISDGIGASFNGLIRKVTGLVGDLVANVKRLLGIKSPSTVFAGIGTNMVRGLEVGLGGRNSLSGIMAGLSAQVQSGFDARLIATGSVSGSASGPGASSRTPWNAAPQTFILNIDGREFAATATPALRDYQRALA